MDYKTKCDIGNEVCFTSNNSVMKGEVIGISIEHAFDGDATPNHGDRTYRERQVPMIRYSILVSPKGPSKEFVKVVHECKVAPTMDEAWNLVG